MTVRASKALLVLLIGLFALLVGIDNIIDYRTNFEFVRHVMAMDTTFTGNQLMWRAITSEALHHGAYALIIAAELTTGVLYTLGALRLVLILRAPAPRFNRAKALAVAGLVTGFGLWFFGFLTVGGEWFQMWQSATWNGQPSAFRFIASIGLVLIFLCQNDDELRPAEPR
jgi:predicted small integral membrane protein